MLPSNSRIFGWKYLLFLEVHHLLFLKVFSFLCRTLKDAVSSSTYKVLRLFIKILKAVMIMLMFCHEVSTIIIFVARIALVRPRQNIIKYGESYLILRCRRS